MVRLCALLMFKNEEKILKRCLDSIAFCDFFSFCDTGSTDSSVDIVQNWIQENHKQDVSTIQKFEWITVNDPNTSEKLSDYGANRTKAYQLTMDWIKATIPMSGDLWMLLVDADFEYVQKSWDPKLLASPEYRKSTMLYVYQGKSERDQYMNYRLLNLRHEFKCVGIVHECWEVKGAADTKVFPHLWICDHDDGANKANKNARDAKACKIWAKQDPTNPRPWFYLGQSRYYQALEGGRSEAEQAEIIEEGIKALKCRVKLGSFYLEVWQSLIWLGDFYKMKKDEAKMIAAWSHAKLLVADRAEASCRLGIFYCEKGGIYHPNAVIELEYARSCKLPTDGFFVDVPSYTYKPEVWLAISKFYTGKKSEGAILNDKVLLMHEVGHREKNMAFHNAQFFVEKLPDAQYLVIGSPPVWGYKPCNPSLAFHNGSLYLNLRMVNYRIKKDGSYDHPGIVHTRNYLMKLQDFNVVDCQEVIPIEVGRTTDVDNNPIMVSGIEDIRIFSTPKGLKGTACSFNYHDGLGPKEILLDLNDPSRVPVVPLLSPNARVNEKNWMPYWDDGIKVIYEADAHYDLKTLTKYPQPVDVRTWRGGAGPIDFDSGKLVIIHEAIEVNKRRAYWHRFVLYKNWIIVAVTKPFVFMELGVEMATGLVSMGDNLIVGLGCEDRESYLVKIRKSTITELLDKVPDSDE